MSYTVEYETEAIDDLSKLTSLIQRRIVKKIKWLSENFDKINHQSLKGNLSNFYKFRVGDYRIIYEFDLETKVIFIDKIGHRREIYDDF